MKWDKRVPKINYFGRGWVSFNKSNSDGNLYYAISVWNPSGTILSILDQGLVQDITHLEKLQSINSIEEARHSIDNVVDKK